MKKILGTILTIAIFIITQYHIRRYYNIDPRIWFFVVFGISFIVFFIICGIFYSEIKSMGEYFKNLIKNIGEYFEHLSFLISEKMKPITEKAEKIVNSFLYYLINFIVTMVALTVFMYKLFFYDDFMSRTIINVIFLVILACAGLIRIIKAKFIEGDKGFKELVYAGIWIFMFSTHFLEFVCI